MKEYETDRACSTLGGLLVGKPEEKRLLGRLDVGGRIILIWILGK
jgi:hypothetical protein